MSIKIYIDKVLCDVSKNTSVSMQKEFSDNSQLIVQEAEYSYSLVLPKSSTNSMVFGFSDAFDVSDKFSRIYDAEMYVDDILIIKGKFKLSEITENGYKGNIYTPKKVTVSDILGDRTLNQIQEKMLYASTLAQYNHWNEMAMTDNISPYAKPICFPYVLYSLPYNDAEKAAEQGIDNYTQDLQYGVHTITNRNVFPAFNVLSVLTDMFATEGYYLKGNIFDDKKFTNLYQTYQGSSSDYVEKNNAPFYLYFDFDYDNIKFSGSSYNISSTLETDTLWTDIDDSAYEAGVDSPLLSENTRISTIEDDEHMLTTGIGGGRIITVPKTGWYRIKSSGNMRYPLETCEIEAPLYIVNPLYKQTDRENIGACHSEKDDSSISYLPFEFQIKKGMPKENPQLYSFNSFIPTKPVSYSQNDTVVWESQSTYMKCYGDSLQQRFFGKNGKQTIVKDYSDFPTSDFIAGARLGDATFGKMWQDPLTGKSYRKNRMCYKGAGLTLPRVDIAPSVKEIDGANYFKVFQKDAALSSYTYSRDTAQALLKDGCYFNFNGYNCINWNTKTWDTTTNYNKRTMAGDITTSSAATTSEYSGAWSIDTVVWLEEGDNIYFEVIIPKHYGGLYRDWGMGFQQWRDIDEWINMCQISGSFSMGFVNNNEKWVPTANDPIPSFDDMGDEKEINVNQFLPSIKCNDYLNSFLQTFNLRMTMVNSTTFSIDSQTDANTIGNTISIDDIVNVKDAEYKAITKPSSIQLTWKLDKNETGYADGNLSPYKTTSNAFDNSGYTGSYIWENLNNTSGTIDKKESMWSYCWYKDIKFVNGIGLTPSSAKIPVMADKGLFEESNYGLQEGSAPNTSKTMRFFFLGKNVDTDMYNYVEFYYDQSTASSPHSCKLVIPSNYIETKAIGGGRRYYRLDYNTPDGNSKSLKDTFFDIREYNNYEIDVPVRLTNDMYSNICHNTLIKFNDGLFRVKGIDGHDVSMNNEATLRLENIKK